MLLSSLLSEVCEQRLSRPTLRHDERLPSGERGFSLSFVQAMRDFFGQRGGLSLPTVEACHSPSFPANICRLTSSTGLSLVESCYGIAKGRGISTGRLFGAATTTFSYSWEGTTFEDVLCAFENMQRDAPADRFFWCDVFCASQNLLAGAYANAAAAARFSAMSAESPGYEECREQQRETREQVDQLFEEALCTSHEIMMFASPLLDQWEVPPHPYLKRDRGFPPAGTLRKGARVMSRGWCLLEVSAALEKRHELHISLSAADRAGLDQIILLRLEELTDIVAAVDVNDAQISLEADRDFLLRKMAQLPLGVESVNALVKAGLQNWLLRRGRAMQRDGAWALSAGLGKILFHQGQYAEAALLWREALAGREAEYGERHALTLGCVEGLASAICEQGTNDVEAEALYRRALAGREAVLGTTHPDTIATALALARLLTDLEQRVEAERLHRSVLVVREGELGADHPDTLASMDALASLFADQGRYDEAEPLYQQSLAQSTSVLGPTHPDTLSTMHNLALLLADRGEMSQAESLHRRALAGRVAELGASHPHTFVSMDHLAIVLADQVCVTDDRVPWPVLAPHARRAAYGLRLGAVQV